MKWLVLAEVWMPYNIVVKFIFKKCFSKYIFSGVCIHKTKVWKMKVLVFFWICFYYVHIFNDLSFVLGLDCISNIYAMSDDGTEDDWMISIEQVCSQPWFTCRAGTCIYFKWRSRINAQSTHIQSVKTRYFLRKTWYYDRCHHHGHCVLVVPLSSHPRVWREDFLMNQSLPMLLRFF